MAKRLPPRGPGGRFLPVARARRNPTRGQIQKRKRALDQAWARRARVAGFSGSQDARLRGIRQAAERLARVKPRGLERSTLQRGVPRGVKVMRRVDALDPRSAADYLRLGLGDKGHGSTVRQLSGGDLLVVAGDNRAIRVRRKRNPGGAGKKGKRSMAKARRTAAQKAATRKMIAANRRRAGRRKGGGRARRKGGGEKGLVSKLLAAINGRKRRTNPARRSNPSNGGTMARTKKRRSGGRRRSRRGAIMIISNPRGRRRRRSNPGRLRLSNPGGSFVTAGKQALGALIPATIGAGAFAFAETKWLRQYNPVVRVGARIAAAGGAAMLLKKRPAMAYATMGAIVGGLGTEIGVRAAGGVVAGGGKAGMREIAALASDDPEQLSALYDEMQGMGLLSPGSGEVDLGELAEVGAAGDDLPDLGEGDEDMSGDDEEFADIGDEDEALP